MRFLDAVERLPRVRLCVLLYACAVLPRVLFVVAARPEFERFHWDVASTLLRTGSLGDETGKSTEYDPLYPALLAGARWLFRSDALSVQLLQLAIDSAGAVGMFILVETLTARRRAAVLAAALYSAYPLLIRSSTIGDEFALLSVLLIAFAWAVAANVTLPGAALAGILLGLAILTRSAVAPIAVLMAPTLMRTRGVMAAVVFSLAVTAGVAPWVARNYAVNGSLWTTRGGANLFSGNSRYTAALLPEHNLDLIGYYMLPLIARAHPELTAPGEQARLDRYSITLAWEEMRERPVETLRLALSKAAYFFWPRLVPTRVWTEDTRIEFLEDGQVRVEGSLPRPLMDEIAYSASYTLVAAAALVGLWLRRKDLSRDAPLICIVVAFVAVAAIIRPDTHYRVPMEFVLLFYAAVALDAGVTWWRARGEDPPKGHVQGAFYR